MKIQNLLLLTTFAAFTAGAVSSALAQSQMSGPGGLATSPKVRAMLAEQPVMVIAVNPGAAPVYVQAPALAGSPKVQNQVQSTAKSTLATTTPVVVSYRAPVQDNIAASPKVREQMASAPMRFELAPLK